MKKGIETGFFLDMPVQPNASINTTRPTGEISRGEIDKARIEEIRNAIIRRRADSYRF
jgi:hypothetical protein